MDDKPLIIFDTDMDTDCDDVGALVMLLEAHLQNKIELLGMIADSVCRYAAPCCEAIAKSYGVSVLVGTIYADEYANVARFADYCKHSAKCASEGRDYNRVFAEEIGKIDTDYPDAVAMYRKLLADAEDGSVIVLCVGMLTTIAETLTSEPDEISPLTGVQLFAQKVKKVITMGDPEKLNDFNWGNDALATQVFFQLCPAPIYISAKGKTIITGAHLSTQVPETNLIRRAYEQWLGKPDCGRASWDLIATLFAINPATPHIECRDFGNCAYDAEKRETIVKKTDTPQCQTLHPTCTDAEMETILNNCMLGNF